MILFLLATKIFLVYFGAYCQRVPCCSRALAARK